MMEYSSMTVVATIVGAVGIAWYFLVHLPRRQSQDEPPTAPYGMIKTIKTFSSGELPWFVLDISRKLKSKVFRLRLPIRGGVYVVGDARAQREILLDKTAEKPKAIYERISLPNAEKSMFARQTKDPMWKAVRKGSAPAFSKKEVTRMNTICSKCVEKWIQERLEPTIANGETFDPTREMNFLTFSAIMESAFEYVPSEEEYKTYMHHADIFVREFSLKQTANPLRRFFGFLIPGVRKALQSALTVRAFSRRILEIYRANPNKSPQNTLIKLIENNPSLSDAQKVAEMNMYMAAGQDTTGNTLSMTLVLLAKHPEIAAKVYESLRQNPTETSDYLRCVITESRRFLTVAPMGSIRELSHDFSYNGYRIPKDSVIMLPQILPHRDPDVFGDPDVFRPERWSEDEKTPEMQESLMSFSLGSRNCIGQSLATAELYSVLPRLLSSYKFSLEDEGELDYFITLKFIGARLKAAKIET